MRLAPLASLLAFAIFAPVSKAAVTFAGGTGGTPVTLALTSVITLPVSHTVTTNFTAFVFEDLYNSSPVATIGPPQTIYGSVGSIAVTLQKAGGASIGASSYTTGGKIDLNEPGLGIIDNSDFYFVAFWSDAVTFAPGDSIILSAGAITLASTVTLPDFPLTTLAAGGWLQGRSPRLSIPLQCRNPPLWFAWLPRAFAWSSGGAENHGLP